MSCPWAKIQQPQAVNLTDIMSEELAKDLQDKEVKKYLNNMGEGKLDEAGPPLCNSLNTACNNATVEDIPDDVLKAISNESVQSDAVIAQLLQMGYDKEFDEMLKMIEQKFNGASKVSISFKNFKRIPENLDLESESEPEEIEDIRDRKDWDRFDMLKRDIDSIPVCGYKKQQNGSIITKHDLVNNGRKNACKLLSFPPEFQTGDGENFDLKLSNKVYNCLKKHSDKEQLRRYKIHDKKGERATAEFGMDESTRLLIYKMINFGLLNCVNGVISVGKEAVVIHADGNPDFSNIKEPPPKECVLKVFKTTLSEFKNRDQYIKDDYRFKDRIGKQTSKKVVHIWAEKEMANLMRLEKAGIKCPKVVWLKKHVLVMSFIGENNKPAPKLKDAIMSDGDYIVAYEMIINNMKKMYNDANLIHADLSEYNVLWFRDSCYFIDVSQSVEPNHNNAFVFLYRDCSNVIQFFQKKGVPNLMTPDELFKEIVKCDFQDKLALLAVQEDFKMKPHLVDKPGVESSFEFEFAWKRLQEGEIPVATVECEVPNVEKLIPAIEQIDLVDPPQA
ncbi:serine/threonine-protein kinase RIO3 [Rhynchophorus ferrugineus]|uniref:serine/threonine-protein kinase RIO3 n=1 Tax=Rhynchophorus ferrugineus TaxID=354439 RepID=UPI003FCDDE0F